MCGDGRGPGGHGHPVHAYQRVVGGESGAIRHAALHHLPDEGTLERCLTELARVSSGHVLVTYFDTFALQNLRRWFKQRRRKRPGHRLSRSWSTFSEIARRAGLEPVKRRCSAPGFSEQWFVLFRKASTGAPKGTA